MKISTTSARLKEIIAERGIKQVDILNAAKPFCTQYGVKLAKNDLSQYVNGKVEPGQEKLTILGLALNVSEAWLMGYDAPKRRKQPGVSTDDIPPGFSPMPQMQKVPLLGSIACGEPILAEEHIEGYVGMPDNIRADFALICKGDSMVNAGIRDGDVVYIRKQETVENGQIAAVIVEDMETEATLKRFYFENGVVTLSPENNRYPPKTFIGSDIERIRIVGLAVGFTHLYEWA